MTRALKAFRYALAGSIVLCGLALATGAFWPAIVAIAAMAACSIACLALQLARLFRRSR